MSEMERVQLDTLIAPSNISEYLIPGANAFVLQEPIVPE